MRGLLRGDCMELQGKAAPCLNGACSPIDFGRHGAMPVEVGQTSPECSTATTPGQLRIVAAISGASTSASFCSTLQVHTYA